MSRIVRMFLQEGNSVGVQDASFVPSGNRASLSDRTIRRVCQELESAYGNPRHGNKSNPLDELFFIILSTRSQERTYRNTFLRLKREFPTWNSISSKDLGRLRGILKPNGLGRIKSEFIVSIVETLRETFGRATLAPLKRMDDDEAESFLTALPGVSLKIAKCVMMYSLGRDVLPVDAHVHRIARRLGFRTKNRPDTSQGLVEAAVPPELRYGFHVNAVAHGRAVCRPTSPTCTDCCVARWCRYAGGHE